LKVADLNPDSERYTTLVRQAERGCNVQLVLEMKLKLKELAQKREDVSQSRKYDEAEVVENEFKVLAEIVNKRNAELDDVKKAYKESQIVRMRRI
jgi:hypothetical protein